MKDKIIEYFKTLDNDQKHVYIKDLTINLNKLYKLKDKHNNAYLYNNNDRRGLRGGKHSKLYANASNATDNYLKELDILKTLIKEL